MGRKVERAGRGEGWEEEGKSFHVIFVDARSSLLHDCPFSSYACFLISNSHDPFPEFKRGQEKEKIKKTSQWK